MKDSLADLVNTVTKSAPEFFELFSRDTDTFEEAFDAMLERSISGLEKYKSKYSSLDEEALSGILASAITMPGISVSTESYSGGHVDLTIELNFSAPRRIKLGEAKIYGGPAYHLKGLSQLIGRYSTGRETRGFVIAYVRKKNIKKLMKKIADELDAKMPCEQQGPSQPHRTMKWTFITKHLHSSGEVLEVGHVGCDLFVN